MKIGDVTVEATILAKTVSTYAAWTDAIPALISADNPRTAPEDLISRATGLPNALTNTFMGFASAHPALTLLLLRSFNFIQKDKKIFLYE